MSPKSAEYRLFALAAAVLMLTGAWYSVAQAAADVEVLFAADKQEITVGELALLTLRVTHPVGYSVIFAKLPRTWGDFEVRGQSRTETAAIGEGIETTSQVIEVTLFAPGTFETPELLVTVRDSSGQIFEGLAPPLSVTVLSVLSNDDTELRDIRSQADLPLTLNWPLVILGVLAASLLAGGLYVLSRRRSSPHLAPVQVRDTRSPFQVAIDELNRIERLDLPGQEIFKEHCSLVSDCIRGYLEAAFQLSALEQTTDEIRAALKQSIVRPDLSSQTVELLRECDLVKFAKFEPGTEAAREYTTRARKLVQLARPAPEFYDEGGRNMARLKAS